MEISNTTMKTCKQLNIKLCPDCRMGYYNCYIEQWKIYLKDRKYSISTIKEILGWNTSDNFWILAAIREYAPNIEKLLVLM
jgi:hypothetical protein